MCLQTDGQSETMLGVEQPSSKLSSSASTENFSLVRVDSSVGATNVDKMRLLRSLAVSSPLSQYLTAYRIFSLNEPVSAELLLEQYPLNLSSPHLSSCW